MSGPGKFSRVESNYISYRLHLSSAFPPIDECLAPVMLYVVSTPHTGMLSHGISTSLKRTLVLIESPHSFTARYMGLVCAHAPEDSTRDWHMEQSISIVARSFPRSSLCRPGNKNIRECSRPLLTIAVEFHGLARLTLCFLSNTMPDYRGPIC